MAYELLTGQLPFPAESLQALMFQILMEQPIPAHQANMRLPFGASQVLAQALSKDPALRYPTCGRFLHALQMAVLQPLPDTAAMAAQPPQHAPPSPSPRFGFWIAAFITAFVMLFAGPPLVHYLTQPKPRDVEEVPAVHSDIPATPPPSRKEEPNPAIGKSHTTPVNNNVPAEPKGDPELRKALYEAIKSDRPLPVIEDLIRRGTSPDGEPGSVPLTRAAQQCRPDVVRLLLANHADLWAHGWDDNDSWPLQAAAQSGCVAVATLLLEKGDDPNRLPSYAGETILAAASGKSAAVVRLLLDHGAKINAFGAWLTPLAAAAMACQVEITGVLLERGANINGAGDRGVTPLMAAADAVCEPTTSLLLAKGARVNQADSSGKTALYHAIDDDFTYRGSYNPQNMLPVARRLLEAGASPNVSPRGEHPGVTPLMLTLTRQEIWPLFRPFLDKGADPKAVDGQGRTALVYAVEKLNYEAFDELLTRKAPVNARDRKGLTVLDYAKEIHDDDVKKKFVARLSSAGAVE